MRGALGGSAHLEIVDPATGELFDRILVQIASVQWATLRPSGLLWLADPRFAFEGGEWVLFAGAPATVVLALNGWSGRLIDQDAKIEGPGKQSRWDVFDVEAVPAGALELGVRSGSFRGTARVDTVDHIDDLEVVVASGGDTSQLRCFRATLDGRAVLNAPLIFESSAPVQRVNGTTCVSMTIARGARATLTVSAAGHSETFSIEGGTRSAKPAATVDEEPLGAPGEIASAP